MKKRIISLVLACIMVLSMIPAVSAKGLDNFKPVLSYADRFIDVAADQWYASNVSAAYEMGLIKGISDTEFNPDGNITVAEAIALACRLHSIYHDAKQEFEQGDVWYQVYVDYAIENGIISEDDFTNFNATATRVEFAEIFAKALPEEALTAINRIHAGQIPDVAKNAAVYLLYNAGVLTGSDEDGTFLPNSSIRRSEVAAIVTRMADKSLRIAFSLVDTDSDKEASAWEELTEDDGINFSTLLTIYEQTADQVVSAEELMNTLAEEEVPSAEAVAMCYEYLAVCYEYFHVLAAICENYDYLEEAGDLATLAMDVIEPFLDLPVPEPDMAMDYYLEQYIDCVETVVTIASHLGDEISDLSSMF